MRRRRGRRIEKAEIELFRPLGRVSRDSRKVSTGAGYDPSTPSSRLHHLYEARVHATHVHIK